MANQGTVGHVVDKRRAKILFSTILPVLRGAQGDVSHDSWQAEINNIGRSRLNKFNAAQKDDETGTYNAEEELANYMNTVAQGVQSVAQERHGANYLSYNIQGFQGRQTPQQSRFNPVRDKAVRMVTRSATPSVAQGNNRVDKALRQIYAMMLLPKSEKGDTALPDSREQKLKANTPKLEQWGNRLKEVLVMTDEQYEAVADAIANGVP